VSRDKHLGNVIGQDSCKIQIQQNINEFNGKVNMTNTHLHRNGNGAPTHLYNAIEFNYHYILMWWRSG
jgi:hypothetical protein